MGCGRPLAASSKSVVKEGTFVFSGEGYLSAVIDIQQHWTALGCTHPSGANHSALPEKFTPLSALDLLFAAEQSRHVPEILTPYSSNVVFIYRGLIY